MDFSVSSLFAGILFSGVGLYLLNVGKSRANIKLSIIGVVLFLYTIFTTGPWMDWGIGFALCGAAYLAWE